ncbi:sensor histidine kinase [Streptacidiphilus pinicola]|uniref:histidine kinase n=1 Tax=Streptacidiphilus pinicola TaxID=2219663 RepID=A0A2X0IJ38_9ACTN|nr:histidine kinase [Streptacidiphilus pinicola]RAG83643.1 sensor histidine kinase [Streptacidiphilus pinicola]
MPSPEPLPEPLPDPQLDPLPAPLRRLPSAVVAIGSDALIALIQTCLALLGGLTATPNQWRPFDLTAVALTCVINLLAVVRRRLPLGLLLICGGLWAWYIALGYWPVVNSLAPMLAFYTVASRRPARVTAGAWAAMAAVWVFGGLRTHDSSMVSVVAQAVAFPAILWRFGASARLVNLRNRQLAEAAQRLREEQRDRLRRAAMLERTRIARELHDLVAHHLSVVCVQAGLARYVLPSDRETAERALDTTVATAGEALEEMRRLLGLLRTDPADADPADAEPAPDGPSPGLAQLPALLERVRGAGVEVALERRGEAVALPPGPDLCAYRIVQESLTNIIKHAPGATAQVTLDYRRGGVLHGAVRDSGRGAGPAVPEVHRAVAGGGGKGLLGMRERAELYGGALTAGPLAGGGFEIAFELPLPGTTMTEH